MGRRTPKDIMKRIETVRAAWERMRPNTAFAGVTLEQFKAAITPCLNTREKLHEIALRRQQLIRERVAADHAAYALIFRIVNGVKAHPDEGEDGDLYSAMGYVRKSMRRSGLMRKRPDRGNGSKRSPSDGSALP